MLEHKIFLYSIISWNILSLIGFILGQRIYLNYNVSSIFKGYFSVVVVVIFAIFVLHSAVASVLFFRSREFYSTAAFAFIAISPFLISSKTSGLKTANKEIFLQIVLLGVSLFLLVNNFYQ